MEKKEKLEKTDEAIRTLQKKNKFPKILINLKNRKKMFLNCLKKQKKFQKN